MNATNRISSEQFLHAWRAVWKNKFSHDNHFDLFASSTKWTEFMLTDDSAFLKCVAKHLGFPFRSNVKAMQKEKNCLSEFYAKLDMVLLSANEWAAPGHDYPLLFEVAIEHENEPSIENEMWKLIFLRAPLKIIICYNDVEEKIKDVLKMLYEANAAFPENECTEYLFIVGDHHGSDIRWRWKSGKPGGKLQPL